MAARPESKKKRAAPPPFERTPPQSIEAERSVLGAMLLNNDVIGVAIEVLRDAADEVFYVAAHQHIYAAMVELFRKNQPVDAVTIVHQLTSSGMLEEVGGVSYIADLSGAVPTSANIEYYARIVLETAVLRKLITTCSRVVAEAYKAEGEVAEILDRAESDIFAIAEQRQVNPIYKVSQLLPDSIRRFEDQMKNRGMTGVPTGFHKLDTMLSGMQPSDMIVVAARPSVGKTALALNIGSHVACRLNKGVLIFSLEMAKEMLVQRLLCMEGEVDSQKLREGFLAGNEFTKIQKAADVLSRAPFYIDDTPNISVLELRSKARRHAAQHQIDLLIIDYIQLMNTGRRAESRQVEIAEISRSVKGLARELRVPVLALAQLSREAEKDEAGGPKLSHLRESGAIEQDADVVLMLSRPPRHETEGNENMVRVNIAKQRNGPTGDFEMLFRKEVQKFGDLARGPGVPHGPPPEAAGAEVGAYDFDEEYFEDDTPF